MSQLYRSTLPLGTTCYFQATCLIIEKKKATKPRRNKNIKVRVRFCSPPSILGFKKSLIIQELHKEKIRNKSKNKNKIKKKKLKTLATNNERVQVWIYSPPCIWPCARK